jgi:hypothetical protein
MANRHAYLHGCEPRTFAQRDGEHDDEHANGLSSRTQDCGLIQFFGMENPHTIRLAQSNEAFQAA